MDKDFEHAESVRQAKRQEQDRTDFNNEMAGNDTGRMTRFGLDQHRDKEAQEKEKRKKSALETLLQNTEYREVWTSTITALNEADQAVHDALNLAAEKLSEAQNEHEDLQTKASQEKLDKAEEHYDHVQECEDRLTEIREEIEDENNPASLDRLGELTQIVQDIEANVSPKPDNKHELGIKHVSPASVPDLAL